MNWGALVGALAGNRRVRAIVALAAGIALLLGGMTALALTAVFIAVSGGGSPPVTGESCAAPAATQAAWSQWSAQQMTNAATIFKVGTADHVPIYGEVIAEATSMQEASLVNLPGGDRDSLGLFQQRPSQGWGTPAQIMDPVYAAQQFYSHLEQVSGWQQIPLTQAAQAVQRSAYPGAYAQWQGPATALVARLAGGSVQLAAAWQPGSCTPGQLAAASPAAVRAVLAYAYSALGTLYDFGGTCTDPHSPDMALHCDCSSLVQQSFLHGAGLHLPRVAQAQWEWGTTGGHGQVVPASQAQVGDVVYFPSYLGRDTIGHTGIVVDPKRMIMIAAPETGKPVGFSSYNPSGLPYGTHLFTILRFLG